MGTRADFYVGVDKKAKWLGSIAWDGYPEGIDKAVLRAKTIKDFKDALKKFFAGRDDVTLPKDGWPWPWNDSGTTDCVYAFDGKKVRQEMESYPDMSKKKNVTLGPRSGLIVIQR